MAELPDREATVFSTARHWPDWICSATPCMNDIIHILSSVENGYSKVADQWLPLIEQSDSFALLKPGLRIVC
jgi:hypothetical protein